MTPQERYAIIADTKLAVRCALESYNPIDRIFALIGSCITEREAVRIIAKRFPQPRRIFA